MQFSSTFTDMFQPTRLNHQVAQCLTNYKGVQLSPAQKEIILNELKIEGTSQVSIAKYLHMEPHMEDVQSPPKWDCILSTCWLSKKN